MKRLLTLAVLMTSMHSFASTSREADYKHFAGLKSELKSLLGIKKDYQKMAIRIGYGVGHDKSQCIANILNQKGEFMAVDNAVGNGPKTAKMIETDGLSFDVFTQNGGDTMTVLRDVRYSYEVEGNSMTITNTKNGDYVTVTAKNNKLESVTLYTEYLGAPVSCKAGKIEGILFHADQTIDADQY